MLNGIFEAYKFYRADSALNMVLRPFEQPTPVNRPLLFL